MGLSLEVECLQRFRLNEAGEDRLTGGQYIKGSNYEMGDIPLSDLSVFSRRITN